MNVALLGFNTEGRSSFEYYMAQGHTITILDQNPDLEIPDQTAAVLGEEYLDDLDRFDLIVRSAGLPPEKIYAANPQLDPAKVTTQINEFFAVSPTKNIFGVTGTKGKGTTTTLIAKILEAAGYDTHVAGNIGVPALELIPQLTADSWVVLELSSFQLSDFHHAPKIGVCLMVVPEHLNWHSDFLDYSSAKAQLFARQTSENVAIYFADNDASKAIATSGHAKTIPYYREPGARIDNTTISIGGFAICDTSELRLPGAHNWQNVCAAVTAAWQVTQDIEAMRAVLTSFSGLPHRIELVRELDGVRYYNDSYASGLHATIAAIESVKGKKIMIVGGLDRGIDISHFGEYVAAHKDEFRTLLLIGETARLLSEVLASAGFTNYITSESKTMPSIITEARAHAHRGDAIVLSPGFASYDMFKNFEDRGDQFRSEVLGL